MKKVININFQGRVIPIEESAYDMLKQYVESLRLFFANEEGKDEIINDIEGRIAELFGENLKKGSTCITDEDVNNIIRSMGRPEDFEAEETWAQSQLGGEEGQGKSGEWQKTSFKGRLYRSEDDKILGGVCAGIANYLRVDPTIVRILFAVITFGGFGAGFLLYIILWIILPSKNLETNLKKRLYRNPDEKVIGGVASGLAAYFDIQVWVPRLIFALPLIAGIVSSIFSNIFSNGDHFPSILFGSFGSSLTVIYIVLWIVIPEAITPTEKLEMRGEKIDLNTIKNTFKEEFEGIKSRAEKMGEDIKERAEKWSGEVQSVASERSKALANEAGPAIKRSKRGFLGAIGILFKAFFLFIFGVIVFALFMALLGMAIGGVSIFPLKDFFLEGFTQNLLAWCTLLLFFGVPVIALITWGVRRMMGVRSKNSYLGVVFICLWVIGIFCGVMLAASLANDFNAAARERQEYSIDQPSGDKMIVKVGPSNVKVYSRWFKIEGLRFSNDSLFLNNVKLRITKSNDSLFRSFAVKASHAGTDRMAMEYARDINYSINQDDSVLLLPQGFGLKSGTKFRNQGVIVTLQVPVGKRIIVDKSVSRKLDWIDIDFGHMGWDEDWDEYERYSYGVEYLMTENGLERVDKDIKKKKRRDRLSEDEAEELRRDIEMRERELERRKRELEKRIDPAIIQQTASQQQNKQNHESNPGTLQSALIFRSII